jgi:phage/plasmid-like protein (TIGR03299 family)
VKPGEERKGNQMAHEVETMAYVGNRGLPWHIGETRDRSTELEDVVTGSEMLVAAGIDWHVDQRKLYIPAADGGFVEVPGWVSNTRMSDDKSLGVVRPSYKVLQNAALAEFGDALVDDGGAKYETGGSLRGGQLVFLSMELPEHIKVEGDDSDYTTYLLLTNGHDGWHKFTAVITVVRAVCANTVSAALGGAQQRFAISHRSDLDGRVGEARRALSLTFKFEQQFSEVANKLAAKSLSERQVEAILTAAFPYAEDIKPGKFEMTTFAKVFENWHTTDTIAPDMRGTGWGVFNAVTEYLDHEADYKGGKRLDSESTKAESLIMGRAAATKDRVLDLLLKV